MTQNGSQPGIPIDSVSLPELDSSCNGRSNSFDGEGYAFAVYCYGDFYKYAPYFALSSLTAYPESEVCLYFGDDVPGYVDEQLEIVADSFNGKVHSKRIDENLHESAELLYQHAGNHSHIRPGLRWLIRDDDLEQFDGVYFGDVDFIIVPELPSPFEYHDRISEFIGAPFSNVKRPEGGRASGLHYVKPAENYFKRIHAVLDDEAHELIAEPLANEEYYGFDERLLYSLLLNTFGREAMANFPEWRPYPGYHLHAVRSRKHFYKFDHRHVDWGDGKRPWITYDRKRIFEWYNHTLSERIEWNQIQQINCPKQIRMFDVLSKMDAIQKVVSIPHYCLREYTEYI